MTLPVVVTVTMGLTMLVTETGTTIVKIPCLKMIIWVTGVLREADVGDSRFDNLSGKHLQRQVIDFSQLKNLC